MVSRAFYRSLIFTGGKTESGADAGKLSIKHISTLTFLNADLGFLVRAQGNEQRERSRCL